MKIEFHKRAKKQSQGEPIASIPIEESQVSIELAEKSPKTQFQPPKKIFEHKKPSTPSSVHSNPMSKKFEPQKVGVQDLEHVIREKEADLEKLQAKLKSGDTLTPVELEGPGQQITKIISKQVDPDNVYLKKLLDYEQQIIKEQEDKPLWSAGILEVEICQTKRLENIQHCERLLFQRLRATVKSKLFKAEHLLIPNEDIVARGGIWAQPKRLRLPDQDVKKKIRKNLTSVFAKTKQAWVYTPNKQLKIE